MPIAKTAICEWGEMRAQHLHRQTAEADTQRDNDECSGCVFFFHFISTSFHFHRAQLMLSDSDAPRSLTENEKVERKKHSQSERCDIRILVRERARERQNPHICAIFKIVCTHTRTRWCECTSVVEYYYYYYPYVVHSAQCTRISRIFKMPLQRSIKWNEWQISGCHFTDYAT